MCIRDSDYAAVHARVGGGKIDLLGAAQPDIVDIHSLLQQPLYQGALDGPATEADVVPDTDLARLEDRRVSCLLNTSDAAHQRSRVDLGGRPFI